MARKSGDKVLKPVNVEMDEWAWITKISGQRKLAGHLDWSQAAILKQAVAALRRDLAVKAVPLQPGSTIAKPTGLAIESPNLEEISGERKEWVLKLLRILQSKEEEVIQQTIHIIELGVERINAGSDVSIAQSARDHIDAPVKGAGTHRKKSGRASGK